jgi:tRNA(Ile)-lysidine synthase
VTTKKKEKKWSPLHHQVWRTLSKHAPKDFQGRTFLLCVSGGVDSVALFHIFRALPIQVEVFHAHHGPGNNIDFRNQAQDFVRSLCAQYETRFTGVKAEQEMNSEKEFRDFRRAFLKEWLKRNPTGIIVMAHHAQDLLETRIMRLIRGTGPEGLRSMEIFKGQVLRPFLEMEPSTLKKFLISENQTWCDDPSNEDQRYFRNWLRKKWLPILEKARPGSLYRLGQSLENLSDRVPEKGPAFPLTELSRAQYSTWNQKQQLQHLALLLKSQGLESFTTGQLKEVQKRLDNAQGRLMFKAAGASWTVNAQRILVQPLEVSLVNSLGKTYNR